MNQGEKRNKKLNMSEEKKNILSICWTPKVFICSCLEDLWEQVFAILSDDLIQTKSSCALLYRDQPESSEFAIVKQEIKLSAVLCSFFEVKLCFNLKFVFSQTEQKFRQFKIDSFHLFSSLIEQKIDALKRRQLTNKFLNRRIKHGESTFDLLLMEINHCRSFPKNSLTKIWGLEIEVNAKRVKDFRNCLMLIDRLCQFETCTKEYFCSYIQICVPLRRSLNILNPSHQALAVRTYLVALDIGLYFNLSAKNQELFFYLPRIHPSISSFLIVDKFMTHQEKTKLQMQIPNCVFITHCTHVPLSLQCKNNQFIRISLLKDIDS